jgi:hypothetical protein
LLDAHPRIACAPETKFIAGCDAFLRYPQASRGLTSIGASVDELAEALGGLVDTLMCRFARSGGKVRWADKTPNYYRILPLIDLMFRHKAVYINIVRHPLDTVASLEGVAAFMRSDPEDPDIADAITRPWPLADWLGDILARRQRGDRHIRCTCRSTRIYTEI